MNKPSFPRLLLLSASLLLASCGNGEPTPSSSIIPSSEESVSSTASLEESSSSDSPSSTEESSPSSEESSLSSEESSPSSSESSSSEPEVESSSSEEDATPSWAIKAYGTEHIEVEAVDENGNPLDRGVLWGKVYVKVTVKDENYGLATLTASYKKKSSEESTTTLDILNLFASAPREAYRVFTVYDLVEDSEIEITATEKSLSAYKDQAFVGDYFTVGLSAYAAKSFTSFDTTRTLSINAAGEVQFSNRDTLNQIDSLEENAFLTRSGNLTKRWYVADNLVFASPDENRNPFAYGTNDYFYAIKKKEASDSAASYSIGIETFTIDSVRYMLASVSRNGVPYASALAAHAPKEADSYFVPNVTVNLLQGSSICDADAVYEVSDGTGLRFVVSAKEAGGAENRVFVTGPYGSFALEAGEIFLDGVAKATYAGETFAYSLDGTTLTLTKGLREIVFTLDLEAHSATLVSDGEASGYDFHGKSYTGTFYSDWDEAYEQVHVSFHATSPLITTYVRVGGIYYFNGTENYSTYAPSSYSYDEATFTLTASIIDVQNKSGKAFSMVFDPLANTWQITSGNWSNVYTFANCVLTADA